MYLMIDKLFIDSLTWRSFLLLETMIIRPISFAFVECISHYLKLKKSSAIFHITFTTNKTNSQISDSM